MDPPSRKNLSGLDTSYYCLGRLFCSPPLEYGTKAAWRAGSSCVCLLCPCLKLCFWEWKDRLDEATLIPGLITSNTFIADYFGQSLKALKAEHKRMRPELCRKYGIHRGLGMEDMDVRFALNSITRDEMTLFYRNFATQLKWLCPAILNAFCCCFKDMTHFQEKIKSGEAYDVTCCGPFFTKPSPDYNIQDVEGQIGKNDELVILVSAPGDFHPWHGREEEGPGNVHSTFKKYADQSEGCIRFCPIQKGKSSEHGNQLVKPERLDPMDPDLRDYFVALADRDHEDLDLWKAYWISNIKREIVNAKLDYSRMLSKVTFVGIYGGREGAASERRELAKLGKIFDSRQEITEINELFIKSVACCLACGMKDVCFPGWSTGISMYQACFGRLLLCTPIKQTRLQMVFPLPSDFEEYIRNPKCTVLLDAFKNKLVEIDPPEPQEMVESKSSALQPIPASSKKCSPQSEASVAGSLSPLSSGSQDHAANLNGIDSGRWAYPPDALAKKQALCAGDLQPLLAAKETQVAGIDWAAKYRHAMERQQQAMEVLLQGGGVPRMLLLPFSSCHPMEARRSVATVGDLGKGAECLLCQRIRVCIYINEIAA
ncbi:hypothetical protein DUNSADRAFT_14957 [Dunaliella salina]|uniref:Uncharacterized protein n=1 Tax=Dunaliella salina TaxID=3046 RepID=A0ABQ7G6C1_DUNSA|nr:hypothetical protein DUNSADRAFT_14957 [Dunaliella salina]|eukprot:KAF5830139.1 hypothetical protein DUNSADRAFT_14957 [Dunaliella salina]